MKKVRINKSYGEWFYRKEIDLMSKEDYMYYFYGTDSKGTEWSWSTPFYTEMLEFIKSNDKDKENYINCY